MNAWITLALWVASKEQLARISFEPGPKGVVTVRQTSGKHFLKKQLYLVIIHIPHMCAIQWFFVYSWSCATVPTTNFRALYHSKKKKKKSVPISSIILIFPQPSHNRPPPPTPLATAPRLSADVSYKRKQAMCVGLRDWRLSPPEVFSRLIHYAQDALS